MQIDSVRAFKREVSAEVVAQATDAEAVSLFRASEPPMPPAMALGVALRAGASPDPEKRKDDDYRLAIRAESPAAAAAMADRVHGEADIRILTVEARNTPGWFRARQRPLVAGLQIQPKGAGFFGTYGALVRDAQGRLHVLSNSHVLADVGRIPIGTPICQPSTGTLNLIGVLTFHHPISFATPNPADVATARLSETEATGFCPAILANLKGVLDETAADLGAERAKGGRTTGVKRGRLTAFEIDGLGVNYGPGLGVARFNDQCEYSGGPSVDFSDAGDSGSLIVDLNGFGRGLLFAGGRDDDGQDFTYANRLSTALRLSGMTLVTG